jgi:hypothetical protein
MDMNKTIKKEEKQDDIVILDEGINTKNIIEPMGLCCTITIFPMRIIW